MANIIDTAVTDSSFSSLLAAIKAANLIDALKGIDSFIISAPTEREFATLPTGTIEMLLNDINKLQKLLTYHIISGKVMPVKTIEDSSFKIDPFHSVKVDDVPQDQQPSLLMITVSSTSLLIPR